MEVALAAEDSGDGPVSLVRPITPRQLANALRKMPFKVIEDLMEIDVFAHLESEVTDDELLNYSKSVNFEFVIIDRN